MSDNCGGSDGKVATVARLERELHAALATLDEPGAGARSTLECRVADLQQRVLATPARSLADIEARLLIMRAVAASLGEPGYLLHLIDATLADVRSMGAAGG
jgi:hypothetical protein